MIQVKPVDDALPNDPIEIDSEALLEKISIQIRIQGVFRAVEWGAGREVEV